MFVVSVVCCQIEVPASGRSLVQRSPTGSGVSGCDREALIMRRLWPARDCCIMGEGEGGGESSPVRTNCLETGRHLFFTVQLDRLPDNFTKVKY